MMVMGYVIAFIYICIFLAIYFAPSLVAAARDHKSFVFILLINFFLGWTLIGWVAALGWSFTSPEESSHD